MIIHGVDDTEATVLGLKGATSMGMNLNGKAFSTLVDKLYTDKPGAVVRELASNARDAMQQAGKGDQPFQIQIPNSISSELIFRDSGIGLSKDDCIKYLGNLFESSKENSNNSIGTYGLGSKSPFSVTDSYIVESYFNGEKHTFNWFRGGKGQVPQFIHLSSVPTTEENGVTFRIPSSESMFREYEQSIAAQLFFFNPRPIVNGSGEENLAIWDDYATTTVDNEKYKLVASSGLSERYGVFIANMGGVSYPIQTSWLKYNEDDMFFEERPEALEWLYENCTSVLRSIDVFRRRINDGTVFVQFFDIGTLDVPPSREAIEYDAESVFNILQTFGKNIKAFNAQFAKMIFDDINSKNLKDIPSIKEELLQHNKSFKFGNYTEDYKILSWEVDTKNGLPSWLDRMGRPIAQKQIVDGSDPESISYSKTIDAPHHKVDVKYDHREYITIPKDQVIELDKDSIIKYCRESKIEPSASASLANRLSLPNVKFLSAERLATEVERTPHGSLLSVTCNRINITYEETRQEYQSVYKISTSIVPRNGQTVNKTEYSSLTSWTLFKTIDRWYGDSQRPVHYVLIDKEMDNIGRRLSFFIRKLLWIKTNGKTMAEADMLENQDEIIGLNCHDFRETVQLVSSTEAKKDFTNLKALASATKYLNPTKDEVPSYTFYDASTLKLPVITRGKTATSTIRGARVSQIRVRTNLYHDKHSHGDHFAFERNPTLTDFKAIEGEIEPGLILFNSGDDSRLYYDRNLKYQCFGNDEVLTLLKFMGAMSKAPKNRSYKMDEMQVYRLTPSAFGKVDDLIKSGFTYIGDILEDISNPKVRKNWAPYGKLFKSMLCKNIRSNQFNGLFDEKIGFDASLCRAYKKIETGNLIQAKFNAPTASSLPNTWLYSFALNYRRYFKPLNIRQVVLLWANANEVKRSSYIKELSGAIRKSVRKSVLEVAEYYPKEILATTSPDNRDSELFSKALKKILG